MRPTIILNPTASAGKTGRRQGELLRQLEEAFPNGLTLEVTTRPNEAITMTRSALRNGSDLVVAVGGDGTVSEVVNGFFENGKKVSPRAELGFICSGTGKDIVRNLLLPAAVNEQIAVLSGPKHTLIDMGRATFRDSSGNPAVRYFINDCQAGIAATVARRVTPSLKKLGGFLAFGLMSTVTAATYRAPEMEISVDGKRVFEGRCLGLVVMNGRFAGGGMDFAPHSDIRDGLLDVLVIHDKPVASRLLHFPKIYTGKHIELDWMTYLKGKHVTARSAQRVGVEADGEVLGSLPCEIEIIPRAVAVKSPLVRA